MKKLLPLLIVCLAALVAGACTSQNRAPGMITTEIPARPAGQTDVIGLRTEPLEVVRVGFIGLGMRGPGAVERFTHIEGVEIKALCDLYPERVEDTQKYLTDKGLPRADAYSGDEGWKELCRRGDIDLVYICTPWERHTPMAVYAMEQGRHVAVEVPAAMTLDECWALVDTAEKTRRHCMMLENCCYDFFEMATLNMAQQGIFGEIVHVEGAYIHDLRELQFNPFDPAVRDAYQGQFRLEFNGAHTGNPYPTHGLGPVAQILGIHRGDKMNYLVSLSSAQKGMSEYAAERFGVDSSEAGRDYKLGDMNTTLIRTERGRSMMIQHDVTSPRPYSRIHTVSGTNGFAQKYPVRSIALEPDAHRPLSGEALEAFLAEWEHPLTREVGEKARTVGGHGGMDFIMDYRLVYCLRHGLPLDQDVYDAAGWSCIVPLSELSVAAGSTPVEIPDFTRGAWNRTQGFRHAMAE
uniref:Glycoside hydrolase family 109 protein n=1 Tax=termite gut metagenome TaxID=433724 RepID=S0DDK4_9ZZZZ